MNARRALVPVACLVLGFLIGAFAFPGLYAYGEYNGARYRVNRLSGIQEYASSRGWVSQREFVKDAFGSAFEGMGEAFKGMADRHP